MIMPFDKIDINQKIIELIRNTSKLLEEDTGLYWGYYFWDELLKKNRRSGFKTRPLEN